MSSCCTGSGLKTKEFSYGKFFARIFQKYIERDDCLLEIGAGYCEFINSIKCREKHAIDLDEEVKIYVGKDVIADVTDGINLALFPSGYFDKVFMSNFLEHLTSKANSALIRIYLRVPLLWRFFGKQMFIIVQK